MNFFHVKLLIKLSYAQALIINVFSGKIILESDVSKSM